MRSIPPLSFKEGDAEALSLEGCSFDAVVMNFGMLHLARPERAMTEAARVLKPGGCFAFTVWTRPEEAVGFEIILKAIQSHGNPGVQLPQGPSFFRFSDPAECDRTLREAGFLNVRVTSIPQVWRFNAPGGLFDAIYYGGVESKQCFAPSPTRHLRQFVMRRARLPRISTAAAQIELPMPAILASAVKPL